MTLLLLVIMENFEGTRPLAILMRYTGDEKKMKGKQRQEMSGGYGGE